MITTAVAVMSIHAGADIHASETTVLLRNAELTGLACQSERRRQVRPSGHFRSDSYWNGRANASRQAGPDGQRQAKEDRPSQLSTLRTAEAGKGRGGRAANPGRETQTPSVCWGRAREGGHRVRRLNRGLERSASDAPQVRAGGAGTHGSLAQR